MPQQTAIFYLGEFSTICLLIPEPTRIQTDVDLKSMNVVTHSITTFVFQSVKKKKE